MVKHSKTLLTFSGGKDLDRIEELSETETEKSDFTGNKDKTIFKKGEDSFMGKSDMSSVSMSQTSEMDNKTINNNEKEIFKLENSIEDLKRDNEELQKKIRILYDYRKKEGRDDKNYYKESNINESTYADSLTSTASLYNELNTHKRKLDADVRKYQQSIEEQEKRKQEVYQILMSYKEELLNSAETRKGTKISVSVVDEWLTAEKRYENEIRNLRILNFTKTLEMNRLKKELKKMEDYFEGLHVIDFEQLKIENNVTRLLNYLDFNRKNRGQK